MRASPDCSEAPRALGELPSAEEDEETVTVRLSASRAAYLLSLLGYSNLVETAHDTSAVDHLPR